jgi:hypothetical protein
MSGTDTDLRGQLWLYQPCMWHRRLVLAARTPGAHRKKKRIENNPHRLLVANTDRQASIWKLRNVKITTAKGRFNVGAKKLALAVQSTVKRAWKNRVKTAESKYAGLSRGFSRNNTQSNPNQTLSDEKLNEEYFDTRAVWV